MKTLTVKFKFVDNEQLFQALTFVSKLENNPEHTEYLKMIQIKNVIMVMSLDQTTMPILTMEWWSNDAKNTMIPRKKQI